MQRVVVRVAKRAQLARSLSAKTSVEGGSIPDIEGLVGPARKEAMVKRAFDSELFDRDAVQFVEEGTRENPIPILSVESSRVVGVSLPDDAEIRWFTLHEGQLAYDPDTCNFFALKKVDQAEVDAWVAKAEAKVLGKA